MSPSEDCSALMNLHFITAGSESKKNATRKKLKNRQFSVDFAAYAGRLQGIERREKPALAAKFALERRLYRRICHAAMPQSKRTAARSDDNE